MIADMYLVPGGPPNSPPSVALRRPRMKKHVKDVIRKNMTEKARLPGGVSYISPRFDW